MLEQIIIHPFLAVNKQLFIRKLLNLNEIHIGRTIS